MVAAQLVAATTANSNTAATTASPMVQRSSSLASATSWMSLSSSPRNLLEIGSAA